MTATEERAAAPSEAATKGERTRRALLDGAIRRFAADGFRGTSVSGIARDAGLTPAAAYAYFEGKEGLFAAAVDADAAGLIGKALGPVLNGTFDTEWQSLIGALVAGMDDHPLARRVLAGREPEHTERLLGIPALADLQAGIVQRLLSGQAVGEVRSDIDPELIASGLVTTIMSVLIAVLQTGIPADSARADGVAALLGAALMPPRSA
ncbi:MAG: TetR/AcrR family transcriptional regulator [Acidimicrobiales bacterium]